MQFNRLRLAGFKSFVDPTELIVEPGLSGIVGPNGCGKSNLVEALRWVMGETSPKSMRGGAMDDVIFAGTDKRPARNLAEVVLELDNADRSAPAAVNDADELVVSREIERESGSRYRINGREMRARDVQLLFADAATGAHSPALVSQGRVGTLINAKARDRRAILEEAAGISGLHSRRHEAELRLRGAENNLIRLEDVTGQIEIQLQALKRQSRQATRYRKISEQIRHLEATLLYLRWRDASQALHQAEGDLQAAETRVRETTGEAASASTTQATLQQELPALRHKEAEAAAAVHRLAVERDGLDTEARRLEETRERLQASLVQVARDIERDTAQSKDAEAALARLEAEKQEIDAAAAREGEIEAGARERLETAAAVLAEQVKEVDGLSERAAALFARKRELDQQLSATRIRIDRLRHKLSEITTERDQLGRDQSQITKADQAAATVATARQNLDTATQDLERAQATRTEAQTAAAAARGVLDEANGVLTGIDAEITALNALLTGSDTGPWPALVDEIDADPGYEAALGAALGDDLSAPENQDAPVHWAQRPNIGPQAPQLPGGASPLAEHVQAPDVLGRRLGQIGVVAETDGPELAEKLVQGQRLVSREGSLWRWDGFTATHEAATPAATRLAHRNRLKELDDQRPEAAERVFRAKTRADELAAAVEAATTVEHSARDAWRATGHAMDGAQTAYADAMKSASDHHQRAAALAEATTRLGDDLKEAEDRVAALETELSELPDGSGLRAELDKKREVSDQLRNDHAEAKSALGALEREQRARGDRLAAIGQERSAWDLRAHGARRHLDELAARQRSAEEELERLDGEPQRIENNRRALAERADQAETQRQHAADTLADTENKLADADKAAKKIQETLSLAREDRVRFEAARDQSTERRTSIAERIREVLGCLPEQVPETAGFADQEDFPPLDQMEVRLERLKRARENIGAVNLRAEQEAQELDEQLQNLLTERADLESAIRRLRQGIGSLSREGRERLLKAFTQVNDHFTKLFVHLFGGGRAHLELTESDDPLEAGLEILASPPGKRLQVMSLLSGGEQAMTALALIFAVFLTNPAPICVLDEVDAPLDDANVDRFCNMLREIADTTHTRFLVVTHNVVTMSRMDRLFGVTMSERGVSNLVSVDLARAEDMAAVG